MMDFVANNDDFCIKNDDLNTNGQDPAAVAAAVTPRTCRYAGCLCIYMPAIDRSISGCRYEGNHSSDDQRTPGAHG